MRAQHVAELSSNISTMDWNIIGLSTVIDSYWRLWTIMDGYWWLLAAIDGLDDYGRYLTVIDGNWRFACSRGLPRPPPLYSGIRARIFNLKKKIIENFSILPLVKVRPFNQSDLCAILQYVYIFLYLYTIYKVFFFYMFS